MYGPPGRAYVYLVYGMHDCLNIITEPAGTPAALLVRAIEPVDGVELMRESRATRSGARRRRPDVVRSDSPVRAPRTEQPARPATITPDVRLGSGPGLVCAAFGLDRTLTGRDLFDPSASVRIDPPPPAEPTPAVVASPRVGIGYAAAPWADIPWRFSIAGHPSVSRPRPHPPR
ncbi:MAG: DNA-3-methyladenine glycosylase [Chloroflexota bacterium]|jgi:DNA-3-methyladenine glycosylase|nr:DNA-3-methyladenine glycosylase [Chloroflexota bacterium]